MAKEGEFKLSMGHLFGRCRKQNKTLVGGTASVLSNSQEQGRRMYTLIPILVARYDKKQLIIKFLLIEGATPR